MNLLHRFSPFKYIGERAHCFFTRKDISRLSFVLLLSSTQKFNVMQSAIFDKKLKVWLHIETRTKSKTIITSKTLRGKGQESQ